MSPGTRPIVILGMQRSGTSALSGALARLGLDFGDPAMLHEADANNPRGYYEHRQVTILNLRALGEFQMHVTSFESLPESWREFPQAAELRASLTEFLKDEFGSRPLWVLKHPLISLVLPLYNDAFEELGLQPHYLVCVRNPLEAMESESRLDFGGGYRVMQPLGKMAIGSWLRYTLGSVCEAQPNETKLIAYDALLSDPRPILESIVASHPGWNPSPAQWTDALASIDSGLRRNRRPIEELDRFPAIVRQTFDASLQAADQGVDLDRFQALYREFKIWTRMLGEPRQPTGKLGLSWMEAGTLRIAEIDYDVLPTWQTIRLQVDAPPKTPLSGLIYGLPARVWIRGATWTSLAGRTDAPIACGPASQLTQSNGVARLDAVFEPRQIQLVTPNTAGGSYTLEVELLLETGPSIHREAAARLARLLDRCASEPAPTTRIKR